MLNTECGVGGGVPFRESGFWPRVGVGVCLLNETPTLALSVLSGLTCNFVAMHSTSMQFILQ